MPHEDSAGLHVHEDADLFAEAINFTSAMTGFAAGLIEKDDFVALVRQKLAVPGNEVIDVGTTRREQLARQVEAELRPVLRPADFDAFDFDRAFARVVAFAGRVSV